MVLLSARLLEINLFGCQPDPFASKPYGSRAGQVPSGFTSFLWFDVVGSAACTRQTSTVSPIRVGARVASHLHISTTWGEAAQFAGRDGVKPVSGPWPDRGGRPGGGHGAGEEKFFALIHAGFAHKRKYVRRNLVNVGFPAGNIPEKARAEDLSLSDWLILSSTGPAAGLP